MSAKHRVASERGERATADRPGSTTHASPAAASRAGWWCIRAACALLVADFLTRMLSPKLFPNEPAAATLWTLRSQYQRNWGSKDYEMQVLAKFLAEFARYRKEGEHAPPANHIATVMDQRLRASLGFPPEFARPRWAYWNDEIWEDDVISGASPVQGRIRGVPVAPGSDFFDAVPDSRMPCSMYGSGVQCYHVSAAGMSLYLRAVPTPTPAARLRVPAVKTAADMQAWRARPGLANYLYIHRRNEREAFRRALTRASKTSIARLAGSDRFSSDLFDEAVVIQKASRFSIVFEGAVVANYVTEKIVNAFLAGTIPVYWGHTATVSRYFNPKAFVNVNDFATFEAAAAHVAKVDSDPRLAERYLREPPCTEEGLRHLLWWRYSTPAHESFQWALQNHKEFLEAGVAGTLNLARAD